MSAHPYSLLIPDKVLAAIESEGILCNGQLLALNSYENRVYQIGVEDSEPVIAKFYRPERWSDDAILEEHAFSIELANREIPVIAPNVSEHGNTLFCYEGYRFSLYKRKVGRWPELDNFDNLRLLGRFIARIHAVGALTEFKYRPTLTIEAYAEKSFEFIMGGDFLPSYVIDSYSSTVQHVIERIKSVFESAGSLRSIRLHGDCHPGNILWTSGGPHFVDFDDCIMGPAVQDLWMLLSGERHEMESQLVPLIEGYKEFFDFDPLELIVIEALRSIRLLSYSAWLARRWDDPAFQQNFPWFNTPRYWEEQINILRDQLAIMNEPPLELHDAWGL